MIALISVLFTRERESKFTDITVNLAGFSLAILALRTLLVPPDLQALTRIDYILVIQLLLIVSMAFFLNGMQLWKPASENVSGEKSNQG
jgi:hypothetical protein